ncbi:predicted protein [Lichtheimia corymbifera JMRC:FSU:9682]|uniref:Uncharacterized protein n=1 Tax=Lichtheimia corymbifera JMRC:FSU:9682 TaxID=1263082 RepID=A0A068RT47_9FUNG|nr:predicted protein [Lichtheimia corymbifera JMRC:FSU:9682]
MHECGYWNGMMMMTCVLSRRTSIQRTMMLQVNEDEQEAVHVRDVIDRIIRWSFQCTQYLQWWNICQYPYPGQQHLY